MIDSGDPGDPVLVAPTPRPARQPARSSEVLLEIVGLTKRFPVRRSWAEMLRSPGRSRRVVAVDAVTCSIARGEFFGLLGANGAGKTTIFKLLSTLIVPDEGTARVAGFDLRSQPEGVRSILTPVIADERSLNWRLSAEENLRLFAAFHGLAGEAAERHLRDLLAVVGLQDARHKVVGAFSSGMKQRLLLARALVSTPRVLLLDEPTRSLDPIAARDFRLFLKDDIVGRQGCTVLLATHNSEEVLDLCDRVGVLDRGRMIAVGTPADLSHRVSGVRYRVWTDTPEHPAFRALDETSGLTPLTHVVDPDGWKVVELTLTGDGAQPAEVLGSLVRSGVSVARFERVQAPLAELIEDLMRSNPPGSSDA
ncbi:MAG TPA: ABC transporter ATP-binding protein [Longimicrobiaceae bacterium]|nr:ABC transporter ATP-binding protein [Longimicrobiaceae bacterium]